MRHQVTDLFIAMTEFDQVRSTGSTGRLSPNATTHLAGVCAFTPSSE
jgi:hypothetical protein